MVVPIALAGINMSASQNVHAHAYQGTDYDLSGYGASRQSRFDKCEKYHTSQGTDYGSRIMDYEFISIRVRVTTVSSMFIT